MPSLDAYGIGNEASGHVLSSLLLQVKDAEEKLDVVAFTTTATCARSFSFQFQADVDHRSKHGCTPLHLAALKGNQKCAESLVRYGADTEAKTSVIMNNFALSSRAN